MSYIESALLPGESVVTKAKIHWFIYISPVVITLLGIFLCVVSTQDTAIVGVLGVLLAIFGIFRVVKAWLFCYSTELAVTTKRVIAKYGFIRRSTVEIKHDKIESLNVDQSIFGRIFNFGSVYITGSGGSKAPIPFIVNPIEFKKVALDKSE